MAIAPDPIRNAARQSARQRRLGPDAACALCGLAEQVPLVRRRRLEAHHAAGQGNDAQLTVTLCLNCHATATEHQRATGLFDAVEESNVLERLVRALVSLAAFAHDIGTALSRWAEQIQALITSLDTHVQTWRIHALP